MTSQEQPLCFSNQKNCLLRTILNWEDPDTMRENLRVLMDHFFLHEDEMPLEDRQELYFTYKLIDDALKQIEHQ